MNPYYRKIPCRNETAWKREMGKIVIQTPHYYLLSLTPMGAFIFENCDGKNSVAKIAKLLTAKYVKSYGPKKIECEICRFLHLMQAVGALILCTDDF